MESFLPPPRDRAIAAADPSESDMPLAAQLVENLMNSNLRLDAIFELARKKDTFKDLAPLLWNSFGIMSILTHEIIEAVYPSLLASPPALTIAQINRVCKVLDLLECVASDPRTKMYFLRANILIYLIPFLKPTSKIHHIEFLRINSLQVISAFVRVPDPVTVNYLVSIEVVPLCLRMMEIGEMTSKTLAMCIVHNILMDDAGLSYACFTPERFFSLNEILGNMITNMTRPPYTSSDMLVYIVACYLRIADHMNACVCLKDFLPVVLKDQSFLRCVKENPMIGVYLIELDIKLQKPNRIIPIGGWFGFEFNRRFLMK